MEDLLDERSLSKLRWRCRRGLLENDLLIERFFKAYAHTLTQGQGRGMNALMELADNDLLDLLLSRKELPPELSDPYIGEVLRLLRSAPHSSDTTIPRTNKESL